MVTVITTALVSSLSKYIFTTMLNNLDEVKIDGAPSWYMKNIDDQVCTFAHTTGGFESIEITKNKVKYKLIKKIDGIIEIVVYDNTKYIKSKKDKEFIKKWSKDPNLEYDPYFYERKRSLDATIKAVDDGSMKMYDFNETIDELITELESSNGDFRD
jgi:hypothetical protein